ncbi:mechanosensitive ion channel family protein [Hathewaya massiliensis]|uniref:mechanosensitive ion channel family protein n=1 Tax=Hathewaya massiliensis TaxID=1964382 RepID=UPI0011586E4F|nr:mechanosensitive ion channel family protein [Hathewaya massiliensis]
MSFSQLLISSTFNILGDFKKFLGFFTKNDYENIKRFVFSIAIFLVFLLLRKVFTKYVFSLFKRLLRRIKVFSSFKIVTAFEKPINGLFILFGTFFALRVLGINYFSDMTFITRMFRSIFVVLVSSGFYNLSEEVSVLPDNIKEKFGLNGDKILFPFISKCLKFIIIALAATIILSEWNINIQMFITGLGLGGLAISLAAKDAASNIIAGFILILEKPFNIGDSILTGTIEGVVEDISFRSTKIRTFTQEVVIVPNSEVANKPIINFTRRNKRKCTFTISISYETSRAKIEKAMERIKYMIESHKKVVKEDVMVNLEKVGAFSLDIGVYFYTNVTDLKTFSEVREEINLNILDILGEEGIEIPYPTNTIHIDSSVKSKDIIEEDVLMEEIANKDIS